MGDSHVGLQARLMSQALRKLGGIVNKTNTICIFINQLREKVGVMFGNPETTPGGRALKFYSTVRLDVRRAEQIKVGSDVWNMPECGLWRIHYDKETTGLRGHRTFEEGVSGCSLHSGL